MPRGTIYGIYDISEQIGVSPWYFWADVPVRKNTEIYALREGKIQGPPSVKYRGIFLNDEQPGLTNWVSSNWPNTWNDKAGFNYHFHAIVAELLLRLRANYLWPTVWASMFYVDDPINQPLMFAYEIVMGSSHTEPLMRAQNEFGTFYEGEWAYNENNETIDEYFRYGVQRAKPYARNSLWTMAMRGSGDTAIEGLGIDAITTMLETLVENQREIMSEGLGIDDISTVPQSWCLYKEVQSYQERGLKVPEDITLLWADDNWGNNRRLPLANETSRSGGAGIYYHFDYVGGPRSYKWINTVQLSRTSEQMHMAYARQADRIWIVNVGDLKPLEVPISHFLDLAYDAGGHWDVDSTERWVKSWVVREFGSGHEDDITSLLVRYGMYAARRKYELVDTSTYSLINYNEAEAVLKQWQMLEDEAEALYEEIPEDLQPAFFQTVLHPIAAGRIVHDIYVTTTKNSLYALQKRNTANEMADRARSLLNADANLTMRWDEMADGKWAHMLDQTHLGHDGYWQQPMRNTLPPLTYVQTQQTSLAGNVRLGVEASNASIPGDDKFHDNSGNTLVLPPLDRYGPQSRWFDVFSAGTAKQCEWSAAVGESWLNLSSTSGVVGTEGEDTRVYVSVDWASVPDDVTSEVLTTINVTTPCREWDKSNYGYDDPIIEVPIFMRSAPDSFDDGFIESDGYIAIEAPHHQAIVSSEDSNATYHTFNDYGRTLGGVGLWPLDLEKLSVDEAPYLEYELYIFSNDTLANVTLYISPHHNYLGQSDPLEYAISLDPAGDDAPSDPELVRPVGPPEVDSMPLGWDSAVADAVWGRNTDNTTSSFQVNDVGAYTLRVWCLMPSIIIQKIVIDLGGVRDSYLGPPESFWAGKDEMGRGHKLQWKSLNDSDTEFIVILMRSTTRGACLPRYHPSPCLSKSAQ